MRARVEDANGDGGRGPGDAIWLSTSSWMRRWFIHFDASVA